MGRDDRVNQNGCGAEVVNGRVGVVYDRVAVVSGDWLIGVETVVSVWFQIEYVDGYSNLQRLHSTQMDII